MGVLIVNTAPGAEIFVDGERIGSAPLAPIPAAVGAREVLVRHVDLGERRQSVDVTPGKPVELSVLFEGTHSFRARSPSSRRSACRLRADARSSTRAASGTLDLRCRIMTAASYEDCSSSPPRSARRRSSSSAQKPYSAPRTPWGHPDLQGTWTTDDARSVPLQRAPEFGDRRLLTDQEYADRKRRDDETRGDVRVAAGTFVGEVGTRTHRQTSLVIEPANGRVPARTPAADQRMAALDKAVNPLLPLTWEDRSLFERCISRGALASLPTLYGNGLRIVQGPGVVAISHEMIHETRIIPIDGRLPGERFHSYMGYSTGKWDGDTLVIETSGFTNKTALAGTRHTEKLRVVERLTRTAEDTITYEATVTDPDTWTAPWKVSVPLTTQPGYEVYPYECHEGNNALRNMLSAARAEEKVIEEYVKKGLAASAAGTSE